MAAIIMNPHKNNGGTNEQSDRPNIVRPEDMVSPDQFAQMLVSDMASLMQAYEQIRKYCYELGEHHNKLTAEYKNSSIRHDQEIKELNERVVNLESGLEKHVNWHNSEANRIKTEFERIETKYNERKKK